MGSMSSFFDRRSCGVLLWAVGVAFALAACRPIQPPQVVPQVEAVVLPSPTPTPLLLLLPPVVQQPPTPVALPPAPPLPAPPPTRAALVGPVTVGLAASLPATWRSQRQAHLASIDTVTDGSTTQPVRLLDPPVLAEVLLDVRPASQAYAPLAERVFAAAVPFATLRDDIGFAELAAAWQGTAGSPMLYTSLETVALLRSLLGDFGGTLTSPDALLAALENNPGSLAVLPFDQLDPRFKALTVAGVNVLSNRLDRSTYPLAVVLDVHGPGASALAPLLQNVIQPVTNRDPARLTQLILTGVTAMSRVTALRMDQKGYEYPARVISDVFAAADITHISNEVPFLDDCVADPTENNLILCSHPNYWASLAALGTDIVGLSGNHVNDFGREGARRSLAWYRENQIPVYGSGLNVNEACAPLLWEHHGNTFAFLAALAFFPEGAWATNEQPGACYYYHNKEILLALVRQLAQVVDVVSVELQHTETYTPFPTAAQVADFRELRAAGAQLVTGVQSHVPQAQEPYGVGDRGGSGLISYGLGNLFFDQMWSWETRTELAARHTVYGGQLLSTELLTLVLEDFAQPRWATAEERVEILSRIFAAAPAR